MSHFKSFAQTLGLKVASVEVQAINPVIFATKVSHGSFGNVVDNNGIPTLIDVTANTAEALTPTTIVDAAKAGFVSDKPTAFQTVAINTSEVFGAVTKVVFAKCGGVEYQTAIKEFAKSKNMKVTDVTVAVQNDVIFSTKGIPSMRGLTKSGDNFYELDLVANTATVVNAEALSEKAKADILAGKDTEATRFATSFGLITKMIMSKE